MRLTYLAAVAGLVVSAVAAEAQTLTTTPQFFAVDPRASFYRTNADAPMTPTMIYLGALAGATLHITPSGGFQAAGSGGPVTAPLFSAIFSTTNVLLSDLSLLNRVPGAVDANAPYYQNLITMGPTLNGGLPTDIPQDFTIPNGELGDGLSIVVPDAANWLFIDMMDDYYADNTTPDPATFGVYVSIEKAPPVTATPEPASMGLMATGLFGVAGIPRWRRRRTA